MPTKIKYPLWKKEDLDGFFSLFQNNLANFVLIAITLLGMGYPASIVFGKVIPGAAISVLAGNFYYAHMAKKLAEKENRLDVTALSYGISTPVMFAYLFGVAKPALDLTGDPELAWKIGVAACFIGGLVEVLGSLIGKWTRENLPRAAMLGALAGVAYSVIGGQMFFHTFEMPVIGMIALIIIIVGFIAKKSMPLKMPTSLFAIVIGTVLAYVLKQADPSQVVEGFSNFGFYPPIPDLAFLEGFKYLFGSMASLLPVIIPISVYNFIETMNNVEAMAAAGDDYNVQEAQLADGLGTIAGTFFGGVFPTTVYIASIGAKWVNAGRGYSIANGIAFLITSSLGIIAAISNIIPLPVIAPILVFVGVSLVSQAFGSVEKRHFPAVVVAMFPYLANYISGKFNGVAPEAVASVSPAIVPLGQGAMFTALILGAIVAFILDNDFKKAGIAAFAGALMSAVGLMHAPKLGFLQDYTFTLGYLITGILLYVFNLILKDDKDLDKKAPIDMAE